MSKLDSCQATQHEAGHGGVDPGFGGFQKYLVVLAQAAVSPQRQGRIWKTAPDSGRRTMAWVQSVAAYTQTSS